MRRKSKPVFELCLMILLVSGCQAAEPPPAPLAKQPTVEVVGRLEDKKIKEASGLARSQRQAGLLWVVNDHGAKNIVHGLSHSGERAGEFLLKKTEIRDWEDLASFRLDDKPYLMVADIGDNEAERKYRTLYFVKEPKVRKDDEEKADWQVDYVYPDGPRDSEAAAVDIAENKVLVLSKRDLPPRLYELPLRPDTRKKLTATALGEVTTLPVPTRQQREYAAKVDDYFWQPVGMDISADNQSAVILTYGHVYYYERQDGQSWLDTLNSNPARVSLGNFENAEAIAFGDDDRTVFVTGENKHARLLRIDFNREDTL